MSKPITEWVSGESLFYLLVCRAFDPFSSGFTQHYLSTLGGDGDKAHVTVIPLLKEWVKAKLTLDSWKDAMVVAGNVSTSFRLGMTVVLKLFEFTLPRPLIYRTICEHLEALERAADATKCFHQMMVELGMNSDMDNEQTEWAVGESHVRACSGNVYVIGL